MPAGASAGAYGRAQEPQVMDMKLDFVVVPVADVDKAKDFYTAPRRRSQR
ncbi:hypothetical protein GCM10023178_10440 [Actinomadura luteofluorescens]